MRNNDELKQIENNVKSYKQDELFKQGNFSYLTEFYLDTAKKTLLTADTLMLLSEDATAKKAVNLIDDFETYLWVVATSYYSMYYSVNALFAESGIKIGSRISHKDTSDVFYHYFIRNNKIAKKLFQIFEDAKEDALDITSTNYAKQAEELAFSLDSERNKRHKFQYNMTHTIKRSHARTSLKRAIDFVNQMELLMEAAT